MTSLFALGWTQHSIGSQNIRTMAMVQLLLGNIGVAGGGMNALRGHSNIQGLTDVGLMSELMPGYLAMPHDHEAVQRVDLIGCFDEIANGLGRNALGLGRASRQRHVGRVRARDRGKNNCADQRQKKRTGFQTL